MPRRDKIDKVLTQLGGLEQNIRNMEKNTDLLPEVLAKVNSLNQTVYGRDGNNGMVSDVKLLKKAYYGIYAILSFVGGTFYFFKDQIIAFFSHKQ